MFRTLNTRQYIPCFLFVLGLKIFNLLQFINKKEAPGSQMLLFNPFQLECCLFKQGNISFHVIDTVSIRTTVL